MTVSTPASPSAVTSSAERSLPLRKVDPSVRTEWGEQRAFRFADGDGPRKNMGSARRPAAVECVLVISAMIAIAISAGRAAAKRQPDGSVDAADLVIAEPGLLQTLDTTAMGLPTTKRADIEGTRAQRDFECRIINLRVVGQGHDGGSRVDPERLQRLVRPVID